MMFNYVKSVKIGKSSKDVNHPIYFTLSIHGHGWVNHYLTDNLELKFDFQKDMHV